MSEFPAWQQRMGLKLGPDFGPGLVTPVQTVKDPYTALNNNKDLPKVPLQTFAGQFVNLGADVFQVIPNGDYDAIYVVTKDADATAQIRGSFGRPFSAPGINAASAAFIAAQVPAFNFSGKNGAYRFFRMSLPYGNIPLYFWLDKPTGVNPLDISVQLLNLGRRASYGNEISLGNCNCPPGGFSTCDPGNNTPPGFSTAWTIFDDFNRADAAALGVSTSGHTWTNHGGGQVVRGVADGAGRSGGLSSTIADPFGPDFEAECQVYFGDGPNDYPGIVFRFVDNTHSYFAYVEGATKKVKMYKNNGGLFTTLLGTSAAVVSFFEGMRFGVKSVGSIHKMYINGVEVLSVTDASFAGTGQGIWFPDAKNRIDNFRMRAAS